jgi:predicted nucleic acid-binding protein
MMGVPEIVVDTNVLVAGLRSARGASYRLLTLIDSGKFGVNISVPLVLEYEDAAKRAIDGTGLSVEDVDSVLDYFCRVARHHAVFYLWRPFLQDSKDDMILELAVVANCDFVVTYNKRDFQGAEQFGVRAVTPREFLREIGELP